MPLCAGTVTSMRVELCFLLFKTSSAYVKEAEGKLQPFNPETSAASDHEYVFKKQTKKKTLMRL